MALNFPLLQPDDIEIRVAQIKQSGAQLLLYKTARTDMFYLDQVVGPDKWMDKYEMVGNMLICTLSIWCDDHWVAKSDTGEAAAITENNGNANKATISDALKRAGTKWGIGRELYSSPFIWAKVPVEQKGAKWYLKDRFAKYYVREIGYDEKNRINKLVIVDQYDRIVYSNDKAKYPFALIKSVPDDVQAMPDQVRQVLAQEGMPVVTEPPQIPTEINVQPEVRCDACGKLIVPTRRKDGGVISVNELVELSRHRHNGQVLCPNCMKMTAKADKPPAA